MELFKNMPAASIVVVMVIAALFAVAVVMLLAVCTAYRRQMQLAADGNANQSNLLQDALEDFTAAYKEFGAETNTPAIITSAINANMSFALFCERFLNNAVSLFITLGLFGTFLGLSMSVASLSELLGGASSDWQNVLNNVGDGLMSALSGMGVAFYTSLVGVACSIVLTLLRSIFHPEGIRAALENEVELWLDHRIAPNLITERTTDESELIRRMTVGLNSAAGTMDKALSESTRVMYQTMDSFRQTVTSFNEGVHGFTEFDYNLRGTVERMDLTVRELTNALHTLAQTAERGDKE